MSEERGTLKENSKYIGYREYALECEKQGIRKEIVNKYEGFPRTLLLCTKHMEICSSKVCVKERGIYNDMPKEQPSAIGKPMLAFNNPQGASPEPLRKIDKLEHLRNVDQYDPDDVIDVVDENRDTINDLITEYEKIRRNYA